MRYKYNNFPVNSLSFLPKIGHHKVNETPSLPVWQVRSSVDIF